MLKFACPKCKQTLQVADNQAGQVIACTSCKQKLRVPSSPAAPVKTKPAAPPATPPPKRRPKEEQVDELEEVSETRSRDEEEPTDEEPARRSSRRQVDENRAFSGLEREADEEEGEPDDEPRRRKKKGKRGQLLDSLPDEAHELGDMRKVYEPSSAMMIFGMVVCAIIAFGGLIFIVIALAGAVYGLLCASAVMIPLGILLFLWCLSTSSLKVIVFDKGFVHLKNGRADVVPWEEVEFVWQQITEHYTNGAYTGTTYVYTVQTYEGKRYKYTNSILKKVEKLGQIILHETSQALYPRVMKAYNKGKTVDFGALGVSQEGLSYGRSLLPWEDIDAVKIQQGYISVSKRGKWFNWCNVGVASVANLYVFLSLVNQIVGVDNS